MKGVKTFRVDGCPLCDIFTKLNIKTKLYYPEKDEILNEDDFVIVDCLTCKTPMVVVADHVTEIGREQWGRILYRSRTLFGNGIKLRTNRRKITDHWHAHITDISKNTRNIKDLRK